MFQAVLQSLELPQWALKIAVPAVGALLALAAALAAACFKALGVTFWGGRAAWSRRAPPDEATRVQLLAADVDLAALRLRMYR